MNMFVDLKNYQKFDGFDDMRQKLLLSKREINKISLTLKNNNYFYDSLKITF